MQHLFSRVLVLCLFVVAPLRLAAASYLFVFDGASPTAAVYDTRGLERVATPSVGLRAKYAFGVADPSDATRLAKFYVVTEGSVAVLDADFRVRGNLFLPEPVAPGSHAAVLSPDGRRLLIAAASSVYVIDTATDSIAATLEPGFPPAHVVVLPGSERAYVASGRSRVLRVINLETNELLDMAAELPDVPSALAASPNGSRIYAASPGSLYNLTDLATDFFRPLASLERARSASGAGFSLVGPETARPGSVVKNEPEALLRDRRLAIDRLVLTNGDGFYLRTGGGFQRSGFDPSSPLLALQDPASGETFDASNVAAVAASPNGEALFIATRDEPRLIMSDSSCSVQHHEVILPEAPAAMALVPSPVEQQNCTLQKIFGEGQVIVENTAFVLTVEGPTGGVDPTVTTSPPNIVTCNDPLLSGTTTFNCQAGDVAGIIDVEITITSIVGCAVFNVKIVPQGATVDGLTKVFGDNVTILRNTSFQLLVEARSAGNPQNGLVLNVVPSPGDPTVACPATVTTLPSGVATINCIAGNVTTNTSVQIEVTDSTNAARSVTFSITVLSSGNPSTGLNKVSADPRTVASNAEFDLTVQAFSGTTPQSGLPLTISPDNTLLNCETTATTGSQGMADISCTAGTVLTNTQVSVLVGDGTRSVVFTVIIVPTGSLVDGLSKVSGDNQFVPLQFALQPLLVRAVNDDGPQAGLRLNISTGPHRIFCGSPVFTDENGIGTINCSALPVAAPNFVTINVTDELGRSLPEPFRATLLPTLPGIATDVVLLSGMTVGGAVGETVEDAVRVRAVDAGGTAVEGVAVYFHTTEDLAFNPPVGVTNFEGEVSTAVTFGCPVARNGNINIGLQVGQVTRTVNYTATNGQLTALTKLQGDNQSGGPGQPTNQALRIRAGDACGNGIQGLAVEWRVNPPDAATLVAPTTAVTNNAGDASTLVRLGNRSGPFTITARVGGLTATFNLNTITVANRLVLASGNNQTVALGQAATQPLVVQVLSDTDVGVSGVSVTFNVTSGNGTVSPGTVVTDAQGNAASTVLSGNALGPIQVQASAIIQNQNRSVLFTINTVGRVPSVTLLGFVNGGSFRQGWTPGGTATIFGVGLMEGIDGAVLPPPNVGVALSGDGPSQGAGVWPSVFRGVSVTVNGIAAPILGLANINGQEQINIQVPFGIAAPGGVTVVINNNGASTTITGVPVQTVQPGIFEGIIEGGQFAAALHADYSRVTPSNPARPGEIIQLFLTGLGATNPPVATNAVGPVSPLARTVLTPVVGIDDVGMAVVENTAFYAPGLVSVYQINFVVGPNVQSGNRSLNVAIGGVGSQRVLLPVQR